MQLAIIYKLLRMAVSSTSYLTVDSVIHGHHVYKAVWTPYVGEELSLEQERGNSHDFYATTVKRDGLVIGRVPRELSKLFWTFLSKGGQITSEVTGKRKRGRGLEVPCTYKIQGKKELAEEFKKSLNKMNTRKAVCDRQTHSCPY